MTNCGINIDFSVTASATQIEISTDVAADIEINAEASADIDIDVCIGGELDINIAGDGRAIDIDLEQAIIETVVLEPVTVTPAETQEEYEPEEGVDGFNKVTVQAAPLQEKSVAGSKSSQTVNADSEYYGLKKVTVSGYTPTTETKSISISENGNYTVEKSANKDGMTEVDIVVNTPTPKEEQSKTMSLGASAPTTVTPDTGKALSSVVPSIDASVIKSENIAEGVTILGVVGTHSGGGSKYGATIDDLLFDVVSGVYKPPTAVGTDEASFDGVVSLSSDDHIFAYKFAWSPIKKVTFPDLTTVNGDYPFYYMFYYALTEEVSFPLLTTMNYQHCIYQTFAHAEKMKKVSFSALTTVDKANAFTYAFNYAGESNEKPLTVEFPELTTISGSSAMTNMFVYACLGYGVLHPFPKLTTISASSSMTAMFQRTNCRRYVFDKVNVLNKINMFTSAWQYCNPVGSGSYNETYGIMFPALTTIGISGSTASYTIFKSCCTNSNNKMNAYFSSLTAIYNNHSTAANSHFGTCGLVKVFLPKVTNMGTKSEYAFYGSTTITELHFGIENQATIEAISGYSSKFGASSATIYFDLANHITVGGVVYDRDGSTDDYDNWYFGFTNGSTTVYIDNYYGAVGDTTYTKSGSSYTASSTITAVA